MNVSEIHRQIRAVDPEKIFLRSYEVEIRPNLVKSIKIYDKIEQKELKPETSNGLDGLLTDIFNYEINQNIQKIEIEMENEKLEVYPFGTDKFIRPFLIHYRDGKKTVVVYSEENTAVVPTMKMGAGIEKIEIVFSTLTPGYKDILKEIYPDATFV